MSRLSRRTKTALDETRMLILGAQILLGFQFRVAFDDAFEHLSPAARALAAVALLLMVAAITLLIAPGPRHRIVERGQDSEALPRFITSTIGVALLPFSLGIGLDIFIAVERVLGSRGGTAAGVAFTAASLFSWYGIPAIARCLGHGVKVRMQLGNRQDGGGIHQTSLHSRTEQLLTEARVILPGVQALLGFQLAIVVTDAFDRLPGSSKLVHAVSLGLVALAIILLMAPAAHHRIVYRGEDSEAFLATANALLMAATLPFALGLGCDTFVVIDRILESPSAGIAAGAASTLGCIALWYAYPLLARMHRRPPQSPFPGRAGSDLT